MRLETINEVDMNYQFYILPSIEIDWFVDWSIKVAFLAWSATWIVKEGKGKW